MIGLIQAGSQAMANRYMYISMLGLLFIIGWAVKDLVDSRPRWKVFAAVMAGVLLFPSVVLTRMQVGHWRNTTTLFEYALKVTKNNTIAENSYGCALFYDGHFNEAVQHFRKAIQMNPTYFEPCNNLGKVYLRQGKPKEAIECFNGVLRIRPDEAEAYANLGIAYAQSGNNEQAIQNWIRAIQLNPDNAEVLNNMAWILVTAGDVSSENITKAIELAQHACELTMYKEPDPLDTLAVAYAAAGRFDEAITTARKAVDAAKAESKEDLAGEIQNRIKLYQAGQRYRQK
jgi:Flp pilus assembly protein TadD